MQWITQLCKIRQNECRTMNCIALTAALGQDAVSVHSKYTRQKNSLTLTVFSLHLQMLWSNFKLKKGHESEWICIWNTGMVDLMVIAGMEKWFWKAEREKERLRSKHCIIWQSSHTCAIWTCLCPVLPVGKVQIVTLTSSAKYFALKTVLDVITHKFPCNGYGCMLGKIWFGPPWTDSIVFLVCKRNFSLTQKTCKAGLWSHELSGSALDKQQNSFTVSSEPKNHSFCFLPRAENLLSEQLPRSLWETEMLMVDSYSNQRFAVWALLTMSR